MDGMEERHSSMREVGAHSSGRWEYVWAIALFGFFFGFFFFFFRRAKKIPLFFSSSPFLLSSTVFQLAAAASTHPARHLVISVFPFLFLACDKCAAQNNLKERHSSFF